MVHLSRFILTLSGTLFNDIQLFELIKNIKSKNWVRQLMPLYTSYKYFRFDSHVFNNRIRQVKAFHNGANCIYTDDGSSKNTVENNLLYGQGGNAL